MANFQYNQEQLKEICEQVLKISKQKSGVSNACVAISEDTSLSLNIRQNDIENLEHAQNQGIAVTIYNGSRSGHASSADFSTKAIESMVDAACNIAKYTNEDPFSGLPNQADIATEFFDCDLYHPANVETSEAIQICKEMEEELYKDKNVTNSDGCGFSTDYGHFVLANTLGFMHGYPYSRHSLWASAIAGKDDGMQSDGWSSDKRCYSSLDNHINIAKIAAKRASEKLNSQKLSTRQCPVIFEAPIARGILSGMLSALGGRSQYQKNSFLLDSIGTQILPDFLSLYENPFVKRALSSTPFDDEGVKVHQRFVVKDGIIQDYFLGSYSARKLNRQNTGHAGGNHNLYLQADENNPVYNNKVLPDLNSLLKYMGTGLLVTDTMGQGFNITTGDYSKGASGFWVENGVIAYPVEEITIAGNLKDMLKNIAAIGLDTYEASLNTGSILLEKMSIAGV
ncbi:MAG: metalloprotease PmbA [Pseudomonadota bacterium]|jgi:PmbA protein